MSSQNSKYFKQKPWEFQEQQETIKDPTASKPLPPSFQGKLNLADYTFSPNPNIKSEKQPSPQRIRQSLRSASANDASTLISVGLVKKRRSDTLSPSPSLSPKKKSRTPSGYASPATYAHLPELRDVLEPNLICVFVGLNPGIQTAASGHAYAHRSNLFWKLLHSSGCTTRRCDPTEDGDLPRLFSLGNTNIVSRPTRNGSELSKSEMDASVQILEEKIGKYKPGAVCIVGKSIWESIWRVKHGRKIKKEEFKYGWQDAGEYMGEIKDKEEEWKGSKVFVACSTSGLAATLSPAEKERIWKELGVWVEQRRAERTAA